MPKQERKLDHLKPKVTSDNKKTEYNLNVNHT
jgi:hypothetical protein